MNGRSISYSAVLAKSVARRKIRQPSLPPHRRSSTHALTPEFAESTPTYPSSSSSPSPSQNPSVHEASTSRPLDGFRERRLLELHDSLARGGNPSRVWSYYTGLLNLLNHEKLPLELHQAVLRQCTPTSAQLRYAAARRLMAGNRPSAPHLYEGRFQTIIRNIRSNNEIPTLEDYNFILEQFAAVGHHVGAMHVYKELTHLGIQPRTKTFGLCFQAIAHRLTLPLNKINRPRRTDQTRKMISDLMHDMQRYGIPFTSVNLDLAIRILKETSDMEGFESLMRWGYGIDLSNPDRLPLEYLGTGSVLEGENSPMPGLPNPQPFSTAALNTTIDTLGRMGDVSKLVQAFEVLTQPMPQATEHAFSSFDDDEELGVSVNSESTPTFKPPYAKPNTTTYNTLLRHLAKAGHSVFARHYLLQAMWLDRQTDKALRNALHWHPPHEVMAPHFGINRGTLMPVFGETNRDKNLGLMRWLASKLPKILRRKRADLNYYTNLREKLQDRERRRNQQTGPSPVPASSDAPATNPTDIASSSTASPPAEPVASTSSPAPPPRTRQPEASSRPSASSSMSSLWPSRLSQRLRWYNPNVGSAFNVDVSDESLPSPPVDPRKKTFDFDLHLRILQRDLEEITTFSTHLEQVLGRTTQRVKERLGRRVWSGKDIYLITDGDRRGRVPRDRWRQIVKFKPRTGNEPRGDFRSREPDPRVHRPKSYFYNNTTISEGSYDRAGDQLRSQR